jgi:hypothetical protein
VSIVRTCTCSVLVGQAHLGTDQTVLNRIICAHEKVCLLDLRASIYGGMLV